MASFWTEHSPICSALAAAPQATTTARSSRSGWPTAHSSARIPPIDPPMTAAHRSRPRAPASATSTATWSRMVMRGKRLP